MLCTAELTLIQQREEGIMSKSVSIYRAFSHFYNTRPQFDFFC